MVAREADTSAGRKLSFFLGGNFLKLVFGGPQVVLFFYFHGEWMVG